jgi:hypothetical protein
MRMGINIMIDGWHFWEMERISFSTAFTCQPFLVNHLSSESPNMQRIRPSSCLVRRMLGDLQDGAPASVVNHTGAPHKGKWRNPSPAKRLLISGHGSNCWAQFPGLSFQAIPLSCCTTSMNHVRCSISELETHLFWDYNPAIKIRFLATSPILLGQIWATSISNGWCLGHV